MKTAQPSDTIVAVAVFVRVWVTTVLEPGPSSGATRISSIQPINRSGQSDDDIGDSPQRPRHRPPPLLISDFSGGACYRLPQGQFGSSDQAVQLGRHGLFKGPELFVTRHGWSLP